MYPQLETIYKDIHANPELSFKETCTAAKLAAEMRAIGFEVTERVGGTGIVAIYKNGPGPTVLVRTELDALPMEEKQVCPTPARSRRIGMAARPSSRTVAGMTSTWQVGSGPHERSLHSRTNGKAR